MRQILVHCFRGDTPFKSYEFGWPETQNDAAVSRPKGTTLRPELKLT
jgi:hypothetical protein